MNEERWLPVVGFEGLYEASDHGRVRSLARTTTYTKRRPNGAVITASRSFPETILKPGTVKSGHQLVVLGRGNSRLVGVGPSAIYLIRVGRNWSHITETAA